MKILVVDDSKVMRSIVIRTLRQAGFVGHSIHEAGDGASALSLLETAKPDLVLTDWNMPEMAGIELLRRAKDKGCKAPFVFITSESTTEMRGRALAEGARDLITKPFTVRSFQAALGELIQ